MQVQIGSHIYGIRRLSTWDQLEIARRLAPVLTMLTMQEDRGKIAENFPRAYCALTVQMSKEDINEINRIAFSAVFRGQDNAWVPVYVNGNLAFEDIGLDTMLRLLWFTIEEHRLIDFFSTAPSKEDQGRQI